jgi:hypothetical protein
MPNLLEANAYKRQREKVNKPIDWDFYNAKIVNTNGIDRVINTVGYTVNNCVPCCFVCNKAKSDRDLDEWNSWLNRIADVVIRERNTK